MRSIKRVLKFSLKKCGYQIRRLEAADNGSANVPVPMSVWQREFHTQAAIIDRRHWAQTEETVVGLKRKYKEPVFGKMRVWDLLMLLGQCVDPTDTVLYCVSQLVHTQQVAEAMEKDGISDPDMLLAAMIHDLGKVLLLAKEAPENVVCYNAPIGKYEENSGLDNCVFQWNHDEFVYSRLKDYLPNHIAWLIRYHSILIPESEPFMDERDRRYANLYLKPFSKYDRHTKSVHALPASGIEKYRDLITRAFPNPISF